MQGARVLALLAVVLAAGPLRADDLSDAVLKARRTGKPYLIERALKAQREARARAAREAAEPARPVTPARPVDRRKDQLLLSDTTTLGGDLISVAFRDATGTLATLEPKHIEALVIGKAPGQDMLRAPGGTVVPGEVLTVQFQDLAGGLRRYGREALLMVSRDATALPAQALPASTPAVAAPAAPASEGIGLVVELDYEGRDTFVPGEHAELFLHLPENRGDRRKWVRLRDVEKTRRKFWHRRKLELEYRFARSIPVPPGTYDVRVNFPKIKRHKIWPAVKFEPGWTQVLRYRWISHDSFGKDDGPGWELATQQERRRGPP